MKKKLLLIFALAAPLISYSIAEAQSLVVELKTGTENEHTLSTVQKIIFDAGSMHIVVKTDHTDLYSLSYSLSDVQKILFSQQTGMPDIAKDAGNSISVYPNPSRDVLFVDGVKEDTKIHVFNTKGVLFQTVIAKEKTVRLNISTLPQDVYILQAGTQAVKFIKSK